MSDNSFDDRPDSLEEPEAILYNIFINNVDSYNGKYILQNLYKEGFKVPIPETVVIEESIPDEENIAEIPEEIHEEIHEEVPEINVEKPSEIHSNTSLTIDKLFNPEPRGESDVSRFKIYGTISNSKSKIPEGTCEIIHEDGEEFRNIIFGCNCIIYDISLDISEISKAQFTLSALEEEIERGRGTNSTDSPELTIFILISSAMTWALTSKLDNNDTDPLAFNEIDFRRRTPHPNYQEHYDLEVDVLKTGKKFRDRLRTYVVCSGITYGYEENILSYLFKKAWGNVEYLPIFGNGNNFIPLIHVADLAQLICKIVNTSTFKCKYIIAVEQTPSTLKNIVKYISRSFGSGKVQYLPQEEAFLYPEIDRQIFDNITTNIAMEPKILNEILEFNWKNEMNFVENIDEIVNEYRKEKNLKPMKILMHGPPCIGKTTLAKLLCDHYKLRYINLKHILDSQEIPQTQNSDSIDIFESKISSELFSRSKSKKHLAIEDFIDLFDVMDEDSEDENYQKMKNDELKRLIPKEYTENSKFYRFADDQVADIIRNELLKNQCQNQGYVLDGFPKTREQAEELFKYNRTEDIVGENTIPAKEYKIIPNYIIFLEASNDYLLNLMSKVSEEKIKNSHYNERDIIRRLLIYREQNKSANTLFKYFKDCDTEIIEIDVMEFESDTNTIFRVCLRIFGAPNNFWMSPETKNEEIRNDHWTIKEETKVAEKRVRQKKKFLNDQLEFLLNKYRRENILEQRILATKIEKFRIFMAIKVLPFLCEAVLNVVEKKPENPVDFFAEYLFKHNSNGKMYNPRYTRDGEHSLETSL